MSARRTFKLTDDEIKLIRACDDERKRLLAEAAKLSHAQLAEKFDVSRRSIENIVHYRAASKV